MHFAFKQQLEKCQFFGQKPCANPFRKMQIWIFLKRYCSSLKGFIFFLELHQTLFLELVHFAYKQTMEKCPFFVKNHGLPLLEK